MAVKHAVSLFSPLDTPSLRVRAPGSAVVAHNFSPVLQLLKCVPEACIQAPGGIEKTQSYCSQCLRDWYLHSDLIDGARILPTRSGNQALGDLRSAILVAEMRADSCHSQCEVT